MREGWEYKKLGEVATFVNGYPFKPSDWQKKGKKIIRIQNLNNPNAEYNYYDKEIDLKYVVVSGDVLISWSGSLGVFEWSQEESILNQHIFKVVFNKGEINKRYFEYVVSSRLNEMKSKVHGITMQHITKKDFDVILIPIPPLSEQEKIVGELDLLSSVIEKKKAQLEEYDQLAQSIFYDMFGDPVTNEKGWEVIQLGSKCEVSSFKRVLIEEVVDEGIPFIRGTELMSLSKGDKTPFTLFITPEHYEKVKAISGVPKIGDLLIPSINANGSVWILDTTEPRYYKDGRVLWVHVDKNSYTSQALRYIMHFLIMNDYSSVASGATFAELKLFVLRELNTILPPLSLQQEFANKIEAIEKQKELIKQSIAETETLFNSRMDFYFN